MIEKIFENLAATGYLGIFLINLIGYSSIFFPLPASAFVFISAGFLNPLILGPLAGLGAALGELTGYGLGFGGRKLILKEKQKERMERITKFLKKRGTFLGLIFLASLPVLGGDVLGISAGFLKYDLKKYFLANFIGKTILHSAIAFSGFFGISWVKNILKPL